MEQRMILCQHCGGEGRILTCDGGPDEKDHGQCPVCDGECYELVEVELIEMEDLNA